MGVGESFIPQENQQKPDPVADNLAKEWMEAAKNGQFNQVNEDMAKEAQSRYDKSGPSGVRELQDAVNKRIPTPGEGPMLTTPDTDGNGKADQILIRNVRHSPEKAATDKDAIVFDGNIYQSLSPEKKVPVKER